MSPFCQQSSFDPLRRRWHQLLKRVQWMRKIFCPRRALKSQTHINAPTLSFTQIQFLIQSPLHPSIHPSIQVLFTSVSAFSLWLFSTLTFLQCVVTRRSTNEILLHFQLSTDARAHVSLRVCVHVCVWGRQENVLSALRPGACCWSWSCHITLIFSSACDTVDGQITDPPHSSSGVLMSGGGSALIRVKPCHQRCLH